LKIAAALLRGNGSAALLFARRDLDRDCFKRLPKIRNGEVINKVFSF
jgi:hypothetical protein